MKNKIKSLVEDNNQLGGLCNSQYEFWSVYVLFKNNIPVYVGCSKDIDTRIKNHSDKDFDSYQIIYTNGNSDIAFSYEKACICFIKAINPNGYNKNNPPL